MVGDLNLHSSAKDKKRNLVLRFCVAVVLVTSLIVLGMSLLSYLQIRNQGLSTNLQQFADQINAEYFRKSRSSSIAQDIERLTHNWSDISQIRGVKSAALFGKSKQLLWKSENANSFLAPEEQVEFQRMINVGLDSVIIDNYAPKLDSLESIFTDSSSPITGFIAVKNNQGRILAVLKVVRDYNYVLEGAKQAVKRIAIYVLGGNLLLFSVLLIDFRRGLKTIDRQEDQMNKQIMRLSNLLSINKNMQKSMKSASSRAVELNEQFLRRVGSDLHDGPAQLIGYAVMRLDKVSRAQVSSEWKQDFHGIKEALDNSLTEIRGISSGLVLPELEHMTIEQCLKTVVDKHVFSSKTQVAQYYKDLPENIALPIKICSYRFVQEGLNNAHRHGLAKKCRVSAYVKDDVLHLSLKDDGMGFRKSQLNHHGGHLGLMGLRDRIESLGGRFNINSELGVGTAIKVSISLLDEY